MADEQAARFKRALAEVLKHEGGYVHHPSDPGGETNLGVTRATYERWMGRAVTSAEMRSLTAEKVAPIYEAWYWQASACGLLPAGLDLIIFDAAVNQGPARARRWLQRAAGVTQDGMIGPKTLTAIAAAQSIALIDAVADYRLNAYRALSTFAVFGRGWTRRLSSVRAKARGWSVEAQIQSARSA